MDFPGRCLIERFVTIVALVGPLACVNALMGFQRILSFERFVALVALERVFARVDSSVYLHRKASLEVLPADVA